MNQDTFLKSEPKLQERFARLPVVIGKNVGRHKAEFSVHVSITARFITVAARALRM